MRKYDYFVIVSDDADECSEENYKEALKEYGRHRTATLYGFNQYQEATVIHSKGERSGYEED